MMNVILCDSCGGVDQSEQCVSSDSYDNVKVSVNTVGIS